MLQEEIKEDLQRAEEALKSAERNFKENDLFTAANRTFVACENAAYVFLKSYFGSTSVSRHRILTKLKEIQPAAKEAYDNAYDLRVQSDYGREATRLPLNKENLEKVLHQVRIVIGDARKKIFL